MEAATKFLIILRFVTMDNKGVLEMLVDVLLLMKYTVLLGDKIVIN